MQPVSNTVDEIEPPASIAVAQAAMRLEAQGEDVINLGWGEPHFQTPEPIHRALRTALTDGYTNYTESAGIEPLRDSIANKLEAENGVPSSPDQVVVTPGAKQAIYLSIRSLVDPGDEVVVPNPGWTSYAKIVSLAGGTSVAVGGDPTDRFVPSRSTLEEAITDDTKAIVLNTPSNPTGAVYTESELRTLGSVARDEDLYVVSDEVYEAYTFDDRQHASLASLEDFHTRTITVNGFSKSHAMTGWRLGYLSAPPLIHDAILTVQMHLNTCATSFVQWAGVEAFDHTDHLDEVVAGYERNRDELVENVPIPAVTPEGAFYCMLDVRDVDPDEQSLAERILEDTGVALTPGRTYGEGGQGYLRASLALPEEEIREASERLAEWFEMR